MRIHTKAHKQATHRPQPQQQRQQPSTVDAGSARVVSRAAQTAMRQAGRRQASGQLYRFLFLSSLLALRPNKAFFPSHWLRIREYPYFVPANVVLISTTINLDDRIQAPILKQIWMIPYASYATI